MSPDNRRHDRQRVSLAGILKAEGPPGTAFPCRIEDLSVGGARVALQAASAHVPTHVFLEIEKFGAYEAEVVWTKLPVLGLKFRDPPEAMAEVLAGIALHA
ncbi:MAG: PilZ domain-containing protein [Rhodospirillales bacterium]|nr:PilZ domain-containing protein [Rhodospirillales bacterium]